MVPSCPYHWGSVERETRLPLFCNVCVSWVLGGQLNEHKGPLRAASLHSLPAEQCRPSSISICISIASLFQPQVRNAGILGVYGSPPPSLNYLPSFNLVLLLLKKMPPGIVSLVLSPANILEGGYYLPGTVYRNISTPHLTFPGSPDISQPQVLISGS